MVGETADAADVTTVMKLGQLIRLAIETEQLLSFEGVSDQALCSVELLASDYAFRLVSSLTASRFCKDFIDNSGDGVDVCNLQAVSKVNYQSLHVFSNLDVCLVDSFPGAFGRHLIDIRHIEIVCVDDTLQTVCEVGCSLWIGYVSATSKYPGSALHRFPGYIETAGRCAADDTLTYCLSRIDLQTNVRASGLSCLLGHALSAFSDALTQCFVKERGTTTTRHAKCV